MSSLELSSVFSDLRGFTTERFCLHIAAHLSEQAGSQVPDLIVSEGLETTTSTHWCMFHNEVDPAHTLVGHIYVLASTHTSNRSFL